MVPTNTMESIAVFKANACNCLLSQAAAFRAHVHRILHRVNLHGKVPFVNIFLKSLEALIKQNNHGVP